MITNLTMAQTLDSSISETKHSHGTFLEGRGGFGGLQFEVRSHVGAYVSGELFVNVLEERTIGAPERRNPVMKEHYHKDVAKYRIDRASDNLASARRSFLTGDYK
jgi:hypothetical protein